MILTKLSVLQNTEESKVFSSLLRISIKGKLLCSYVLRSSWKCRTQQAADASSGAIYFYVFYVFLSVWSAVIPYVNSGERLKIGAAVCIKRMQATEIEIYPVKYSIIPICWV